MQTCNTTVIIALCCDVTTMQNYLKYTISEEVTFFVICEYFLLPSLPFLIMITSSVYISVKRLPSTYISQ